MKIYIHNIHITHKVVCKSGADSSTRSHEIPIWKKIKQILTSNISEIYESILLSKELDRELPKIYLHREFWRD